MTLSYTKKVYTDTASSGNGITASDMNRIETAISNLTSEINTINKKIVVDGNNNVTFKKSPANGNLEIWFNFGNESKCLCFSVNNIGVYDAKTEQGFNVKYPITIETLVFFCTV